jgi:hypothetical protein
MAEQSEPMKKPKAQVDFQCQAEGCDGIVRFDLVQIAKEQFQSVCPRCHRSYRFDKDLREKFGKLLELIVAVRAAEEILGDCNVAVTVPGGEVKIPYALLLTRLNTMITLNLGETKVDFHFWVEPASAETFR